MRYLFLCLALTFQLKFTTVPAQDAAAPATSDIDQTEYDNYKKQICSLVPSFGGGGGEGDKSKSTSSWSDVMTIDEVLELAFVNMAYGLTSDSVSHMKTELGWKKTVIDKIALIMKATCMDDVINESFLNAAKNLFLYYMVKLQAAEAKAAGDKPASDGSTNGTSMEDWNNIVKSLTTCASNLNPIQVQTSCGRAVTFSGKDGAMLPIRPTVEQFDTELGLGGDLIGLDIIIDTVWWMFSTAYARCYSYYYPNEDEILVFFQMFRDDFLEPFANRWRSAGPATAHFDIIFGPYDSMLAADNARKCATAAFQYEDLGERQLVRPVNVVISNNLVRNFKVHV